MKNEILFQFRIAQMVMYNDNEFFSILLNIFIE